MIRKVLILAFFGQLIFGQFAFAQFSGAGSYVSTFWFYDRIEPRVQSESFNIYPSGMKFHLTGETVKQKIGDSHTFTWCKASEGFWISSQVVTSETNWVKSNDIAAVQVPSSIATESKRNIPAQSTDAGTRGKKTSKGGIAQGSSVLIDSDKGCFVTNYHVIDGGQMMLVLLDQETMMEARVIKSNEQTDLAVLKLVDDSDIALLKDYNEIKLRLSAAKGERVTAVGIPKAVDLGFETKITAGVISSNSFMEDPTMYGIDAAITTGSSGGGLYDENGFLIGITAAGFRPDLDTENVNGAVKGIHVNEIVSQTPCSLGIAPQKEVFSAVNIAQQSSTQVFPVLVQK